VGKSRKLRKSRKGGAAIAAGSYGCVFKPALLCKDSTIRIDGVSKLMTDIEATKEINSVSSTIINIIKTIPDNINYFIPNSQQEFTKCEVGNLSKDDLENLRICGNFKTGVMSGSLKNPPFENNPSVWIERHKDKLAIIQQADGGSEFTNTIKNLTPDNFIRRFSVINSKLVSLIKYGIIVMNKKGLFHLDIKPANMVYKVIGPFPDNSDPPLLRLIDWGFAISTNNKLFSIIQEQLVTHTTMMNVPFSSILFDRDVAIFIEDLKYNGDSNKIIAEKIFYIYYDVGGHIDHILNDIKRIYKFKDINEATTIWINYIEAILDIYTINSQTTARKYFNEIYKHNVDIYGVLLTYIDIIKRNTIHNSDIEDKMILFIKKYMYSPEFAIKAYNIEELVNDMNSIAPVAPVTPVPLAQVTPLPIAQVTPLPIAPLQVGELSRMSKKCCAELAIIKKQQNISRQAQVTPLPIE
jgi:hypothetical protein